MRISVGTKLYFSVLSLFLLFAVSFIIFQQTREKQYKIDTLNLKLQDYNSRMAEFYSNNAERSEQVFNNYVRRHYMSRLRVTLIRPDGSVLYDSRLKQYAHISNHASRPEVAMALKHGSGSTVERSSKTFNSDYFYSATYFPHDSIVIRSALPYTSDLARSLQADQHYIWFAVITILLLTVVLYRFTSRLGDNVKKLRTFASRADHGESLDTEDLIAFPADEIGRASCRERV